MKHCAYCLKKFLSSGNRISCPLCLYNKRLIYEIKVTSQICVLCEKKCDVASNGKKYHSYCLECRNKRNKKCRICKKKTDMRNSKERYGTCFSCRRKNKKEKAEQRGMKCSRCRGPLINENTKKFYLTCKFCREKTSARIKNK